MVFDKGNLKLDEKVIGSEISDIASRTATAKTEDQQLDSIGEIARVQRAAKYLDGKLEDDEESVLKKIANSARLMMHNTIKRFTSNRE